MLKYNSRNCYRDYPLFIYFKFSFVSSILILCFNRFFISLTDFSLASNSAKLKFLLFLRNNHHLFRDILHLLFSSGNSTSIFSTLKLFYFRSNFLMLYAFQMADSYLSYELNEHAL